MTPSPTTPKVYEIFDISSPHISETEEDIQISDIEEKFCCNSMQTFTGDFPLNSVQNLLVIASESEEKFDFSPSNIAAGVKICDSLDILEEIIDYQSEPLAPHALYLPANSCRIAKFRTLKKKKVVHTPSRLTIYLNLILTLLDLI